jgi:hypothetical protein
MINKEYSSDLFLTRLISLRTPMLLGHQLNQLLNHYSEVEEAFSLHQLSQPLVVGFSALVLQLMGTYSEAMPMHSSQSYLAIKEGFSVDIPINRYSLFSSS